MNLARLSLSYLRRRPLVAVLNVVLLALGVATIALLLLISGQIEERLDRDARGVDLVVGAKGSPLQLILSAVYHVDAPTGNVAVRDLLPVVTSPMVKEAIPLAMGDSYAGFPVVGTTRAYVALYGGRLAGGSAWANPYDVVLGADVARRTGQTVGSRLVSTHGLSEAGQGHAATPFTVVGVLAPTGNVVDRLVLTSVETVWATHAHEGDTGHADTGPAADSVHAGEHADEGHSEDAEAVAAPDTVALAARPVAGGFDYAAAARERRDLTAVIVRYRSPLAVALFPRQVDAVAGLKAAQPSMELARLAVLLGVGADVVRAFGGLLMAVALLGVFVTLYSAIRERAYDLAMMRTLGATRGTLVAHVLLEGLLLAAMGTLVGLALGHAAAEVVGRMLAERQGLRLTGLAWMPGETGLVVAALATGVVAALVPAWQAYRTDLARVLADG